MAHLLLFEDDRRAGAALTLALVDKGHVIDGFADTKEASVEVAKEIALEGVDAAIVDRDLGDGPDDGVEVIDILMRRGFEGVIIGNSDRRFEELEHNAYKDPGVILGILASAEAAHGAAS